jgi:hypothetical protein
MSVSQVTEVLLKTDTQALQFLLQQQAPTSVTDDLGNSNAKAMRTSSSSNFLAADEQGRLAIPRSPMSLRSFNSSQRDLTTPKANQVRPASALSVRHGSAMNKRAGTAAFEYLRRHEVPATIHGGHRFKGTYKGAPIADDFDVVLRNDAEDPDASFDGMDNVRGELGRRNSVIRIDVQLAVTGNMW